ncbi:MerR family transcriptional regulator [Kitasatospora sp. GAS204B]|uniref:MerR family transcriptional regulator n=1 Tax=unclassified Kitasatospora TaxID=2633591 RepID=UPI00247520C9|nr:MerR family transcriptional regulator [Kitasatospora sp. GAS204B]MDH6121529.1 DNA-binding transcriptional MerR regulator [Kitasatospora sp. GAS204B]
MSSQHSRGEVWSYAEIAHHIGVQTDTVRNYRRHGLLPDPDFVDQSGHPRWYADTIRAWARRRPGHR